MEIKAKELRIGNLLKRHDDSIFEVKAEDIKILIETDLYLKPLGIPLSEEILLKVGFELKSQWFDYELEGFKLGYITDDKHFQFETASGKVIDVESLHHLQNLYFFNQGQELNTTGL